MAWSAIAAAWLTLLASTYGQTVGGNSDGMPCYFPFSYEGLTYNTCIDINYDKAWCSTTDEYNRDRRWGECMAEDLESLPSFDESTPKNVTMYEGETARLMCKISNLQGKRVTWQMRGSHYPITIAKYSFLADGRFEVESSSEQQWNLLIHQVTRNDSGIYQCKVMTQTMLLVREVHLTVQVVTLGESSTIYVEKGKELKLQCNSTGKYETTISPRMQLVPPEVEWFKGDGNKIDSNSVNKIVIHNKVDGRLRISTLTIEKTGMDDGGIYICRNTEDAYAEITVRILNVDTDNKKRGTASEQLNKQEQVGDNGSSTTQNSLTSSLLILAIAIWSMT